MKYEIVRVRKGIVLRHRIVKKWLFFRWWYRNASGVDYVTFEDALAEVHSLQGASDKWKVPVIKSKRTVLY